jgi:hypothetical protein
VARLTAICFSLFSQKEKETEIEINNMRVAVTGVSASGGYNLTHRY